MSFSRHALRAVASATGATGLVVGSAALAAAHVTVTPSTTAAGAYTVLTFSVGHGCDGSPTTELTFQIPDQVVAVTPTMNPNWTIEKKMQKLDPPVDDGHGGQYTERVAQVVYTATSALPDGYRDTMALSLQLPHEEGEKLVFPVIQTCEDGQTDWTQTYDEAQAEPDSPAPFVTTTAASTEGAHGDQDDADANAHETDTIATDAGSRALGWVGVVLGALGLGAGGLALARSRRSA